MIRDHPLAVESPQHELILESLATGIEATHPELVIENSLERSGDELVVDGVRYTLTEYDRVFVVGGGNAAAHVAKPLERELDGHIDDGIVVTDDPVSLSTIDCIEGTHPVPDKRAAKGTERVVDLVRTATEDDLVFCIVTGGGSALLPAPADGVTLDDLKAVTEQLLVSGANIDEINAVRKHLSALKGGQLARAGSPATMIGLVFSDVIGNDLSVIASGPLIPDETTYQDAVAVLDQYGITAPETVGRRLKRGVRGGVPETPTGDNSVFDTVDTHILADNLSALKAARTVLEADGYTSIVLSSRVRGEAKEVAKTHVGIAEEIIATGNPVEPPAAILSGGETTVTVTDDGNGGPNQEFALSAAIELTHSDIVLGSIDTDGIDGNVNAAGALVDATMISDKQSARNELRKNNAFSPLESAGALLRPGHTGTNVNDLRVLLISE